MIPICMFLRQWYSVFIRSVCIVQGEGYGKGKTTMALSALVVVVSFGVGVGVGVDVVVIFSALLNFYYIHTSFIRNSQRTIEMNYQPL